jgi:hypothetical protein
MMTHARIYHLTQRLVGARERARDARANGDGDGYRYARAEARRLARILAEG